MGYMARWGPKGFLISPNKIVPLENLSTSVALKADSENDTSGTSPTNTKGMELQSISLSTTYYRGVGVDPRAQWEEWVSLIGSVYPLYIGNKRFGPKQMKLAKADLSDVQTDNAGGFLLAKVSVTFEEKPSITATATKAANVTATNSTSAKKKALVPTAAKEEKAVKKVNKKKLSAMERRLA